MKRPTTIDEALALVAGRRIQLCIGSQSGFWFIGTAEEFERDIDLLERHYHTMYTEAALAKIERIKRAEAAGKPTRCSPLPPWEPLRTRAVKEVYRRKMPWERLPQVAVLVQGTEQGNCVCAYDYARFLPSYYSEWLECGGTAPKNPPAAWTARPKRPKRLKPPEEFDDEWTNLGCAVVLNACNDYRALYRRKLQYGDPNKRIVPEMKRIERFLSSGFAELLAGDADLSGLSARLRRQVEAGG